MNDYLDRVEEQLAELTERGAHQRFRARRGGFVGGDGPRPPRRRNEAFAFLAAAAVVAAVVAIVLVNAHHSPPHTNASAGQTTVNSKTTTHGATVSTTATTPTAPKSTTGTVSTPPPTGFTPQSFTAISELTWWVLGPAACQSSGEKSPCGTILHTTDGGQHFVGVGAPHAPLSTEANQPGYSQIRFADGDNGFAFGPDLYVTHDGGQSWHSVDLGGAVTDLAISSGQAYAIVSVSSTGAAGSRLMRSPVTQDSWAAVSAAGNVSGGLWVQGSDVFVQSGVGNGIGGNVLVSHDGGASFTAYPAPSPGLPCQFQEPVPPVVWAHCATGTESGVWRSTDGGAQFTPAEPSGRLSLPNSATFAASSDTGAVVGYQQLYRTDDSGSTYTKTGPTEVSSWAYLGFTDSTHGVALGYVGSLSPANERLFYTTDGGQHYHLVQFP